MIISSEKYVLKWEIGGIFWLIIVGSLLHFTYEFSGNSRVVALFSPVNESLWEHLKMGYWALTFFMLIEYWFIRPYASNFFISKALGIIGMNLFIVMVFYAYRAVTKEINLIVDISSFIIGSIICQLISIKVLKMKLSRTIDRIGLGLFIFMGLLFIWLTFSPPKWHIFKDSRTGKYGI